MCIRDRVDPLLERLRNNKRRWCEHLGRIADDRIPVLAMEYRPVRKRNVGRPRAKWNRFRMSLILEVADDDDIKY